MAESLDDVTAALLAQVTENNNLVDSVVTLLQQLTTLLQGAVDNQDFTKVDAVIAMLKDKDVAFANAITANTPAAPASGPVVAVDPDAPIGPGEVAQGDPAVPPATGGTTTNAGQPGSTDTGADAGSGLTPTPAQTGNAKLGR